MNRLLRIRSIVFACLLAVISSAYAAGSPPTNLAGQWHGALQTAAGTFALELTVKQDDHGTLLASLESVDQAPGQAIAVSRVQLDKDSLKLEIAALAATYEGRFDVAQSRWLGTWQQGLSLPLTWTRGPLPPLPRIDGIDGTWRATLARDGKDLRLILRISTSERGTRARLDSPDMGVAGLDVAELSREGDRVHLRVPVANVTFDAELGDQAMRMGGAWQREGQPPVRVTFSRAPAPAPVAGQRPQAPRPPFPYAVEPVRVANASAHIALAGTLTLPQGRGPFAAAVLITGSGPQDRDETLYGHKPFAVLADHLTRNGIAVLRLDDRGVGESGGDFGSASIADFASDARAAVDFLAARPEIDARGIGLIGHSEGGIVGPLAATHNPAVAYLVLLAAPGTGMAELLLSQRRMAGAMQGQDAASLTAYESALARLYEAAGKAKNRAAARADITALLTPAQMRQLHITAAQTPAMIEEFSSDWLRDALHYDAASTLGALSVPILALNGSLDQQVGADVNLGAIRQATANNPKVTTLKLDGLNHMFQSARNGAIAEYAEITQTFAPTAMDTISAWISARFRGPRS